MKLGHFLYFYVFHLHLVPPVLIVDRGNIAGYPAEVFPCIAKCLLEIANRLHFIAIKLRIIAVGEVPAPSECSWSDGEMLFECPREVGTGRKSAFIGYIGHVHHGVVGKIEGCPLYPDPADKLTECLARHCLPYPVKMETGKMRHVRQPVEINIAAEISIDVVYDLVEPGNVLSASYLFFIEHAHLPMKDSSTG